MRVNVGCGSTPTGGWVNFDNSPSIRMARWPLVRQVLPKILAGQSGEFVRIAIDRDVRFANATLRIPCADESVDAVYSSHMIEHLDRKEADAFLREVRRILRRGGIVRLAAPDLARLVRGYLTSGDADAFIASTHMGQERPVGIVPRARRALAGPRNHLWMYDGDSLSRLLRSAGFADVAVMPPGETRITEPGPLDLAERAEESVYVEAVQPQISAEIAGR